VTIYLVVPLLFIVAIVQATIVPHLAIWGVFADLPVLVVASWGLLRGPWEGILWGFIAGAAVDLFSGAPFGAGTLSLMAVGFLSGLGRSSVFATHIVFPVVVAFLVALVYDTLFLLIVWLSGQSVSWLDSAYRIVLPSAVLNAVLMPVVFAPMRVIDARFSQEGMEW
jgi:rod shape-determining protein MreD